jgi:nucleotide-binding universal stress UspA family protein
MDARRILVPLDGSKTAEAAIPEAVQMARGEPYTLLLLRVAHARVLPGADVVGDSVEAVREAEHYLTSVRRILENERIGGAIETHVWQGPAAAAIIDMARVHKADLIVMTSHGRSGIARLVLGSVAEAVIRGSRVPILLVRAAGAPIEAPTGDHAVGPAETSPVRPSSSDGPAG